MKKSSIVLVIASALVGGCGGPSGTTVEQTTGEQKKSVSIAEWAEGFRAGAEDATTRLILDQIVSFVLTSSDLADARMHYGDDARCALVSHENDGIAWPKWYAPEIKGAAFVRVDDETESEPSPGGLLGIAIETLDLGDRPEQVEFWNGPVVMVVALSNVGDESVDAATRVAFDVEWENGAPKSKFSGTLEQ